jgi:hypothetical protein
MIHSTNIFWPLFGLVIAASTTNLIFQCEAFHLVTLLSSKSFAGNALELPDRTSFKLSLQKGWLDNGREDEDDLVTREDLHRDMLGMEPKVKRRNRKGKGYKPLDNRDHLSFSVRTKTPDDPYKNRFQKQKEQQLKKNSEGIRSTATDLDRHMLATGASTTPSRLVQRRSHDDKSMTTVLGEFELEKSTTSGDVIVLGDKEYRVETARCQYKYAGGQRFVMVRKILEVKELTRVESEEALLRQFDSSPSSSSSLSDDFE